MQVPICVPLLEMGYLLELRAGRGQPWNVDFPCWVLAQSACPVVLIALCVFSSYQGASALTLRLHSRELSDSILCCIPYFMSCGIVAGFL